MADTKLYRLTNEQPGPRGVETAAHGLVMVHPTTGGQLGLTASLTDDEAALAKKMGLKLRKAQTATGIVSTDNIPAAGHIDPNAPDAAQKLAGKAASKSSKDEDEDEDEGDKPLSKMTTAELDAAAADANIADGDEYKAAKNNAERADLIQKARDEQSAS